MRWLKKVNRDEVGRKQSKMNQENIYPWTKLFTQSQRWMTGQRQVAVKLLKKMLNKLFCKFYFWFPVNELTKISG